MQRALPLCLFAGVMMAGLGLMAKALYIPIKAELAQVLLERAFEQSLSQGQPVKAWSWADTAPQARIGVKRLGVEEVVLSGSSGEALAFGPSVLLDDRARNITVLAAHRDTHFTFIRDLRKGDIVSMQRLDASVNHYRIESFTTVMWNEFTVPEHGGEGLLALTTCFPFDTDTPGPLRRIAWARRVES